MKQDSIIKQYFKGLLSWAFETRGNFLPAIKLIAGVGSPVAVIILCLLLAEVSFWKLVLPGAILTLNTISIYFQGQKSLEKLKVTKIFGGKE